MKMRVVLCRPTRKSDCLTVPLCIVITFHRHHTTHFDTSLHLRKSIIIIIVTSIKVDF